MNSFLALVKVSTGQLRGTLGRQPGKGCSLVLIDSLIQDLVLGVEGGGWAQGAHCYLGLSKPG